MTKIINEERNPARPEREWAITFLDCSWQGRGRGAGLVRIQRVHESGLGEQPRHGEGAELGLGQPWGQALPEGREKWSPGVFSKQM